MIQRNGFAVLFLYVVYSYLTNISKEKENNSMPKGEPNSQTIASQKWNAKAGYVAKTYKLKKDVADAFAETCDKLGVSKASQLTRMMTEFIEENK